MQNQQQIYSVSDINIYLKNLLSGDSLLCSLWIKGEISNFKHHSSGHMYFSLKDGASIIKCVMFKSHGQRLRYQPENGMEVLLQGYLSVYERDGIYQVYVEDMLVAGAGLLHVEYERLKKQLQLEGLFDEVNKKPLPYYPKSIGIVTSSTGAAVQDMMSIIRRRNQTVSIYLVPAVVQGKEGTQSICDGLDYLYQSEVDVIIVGRGGGSIEDLWCFNEEKVVRKIAQSPKPIISAVGHETDFTLSDFAADRRAATPSMAAEIVVPMLLEMKADVIERFNQLQIRYQRLITQKNMKLQYLTQHPSMSNPQRWLDGFRQDVDHKLQQLEHKSVQLMAGKRMQLQVSVGRVEALNPLKVLSRGFVVCENEQQKIIKAVDDVAVDEEISIILRQGRLNCRVISKEYEYGNK